MMAEELRPRPASGGLGTAPGSVLVELTHHTNTVAPTAVDCTMPAPSTIARVPLADVVNGHTAAVERELEVCGAPSLHRQRSSPDMPNKRRAVAPAEDEDALTSDALTRCAVAPPCLPARLPPAAATPTLRPPRKLPWFFSAVAAAERASTLGSFSLYRQGVSLVYASDTTAAAAEAKVLWEGLFACMRAGARPVIGLDIEWWATFKKGAPPRPVALLQLAQRNRCALRAVRGG
jgi:hypothetical protein